MFNSVIASSDGSGVLAWRAGTAATSSESWKPTSGLWRGCARGNGDRRTRHSTPWTSPLRPRCSTTRPSTSRRSRRRFRPDARSVEAPEFRLGQPHLAGDSPQGLQPQRVPDHLYPRRVLRDQGRVSNEINRVTNFAFMSRADNTTLGGVAPSESRSKMDESKIDEILARSLCPPTLFYDDYDSFIEDREGRVNILMDAALQLAQHGHSASARRTTPRLPHARRGRFRLDVANN